MCPDRQGIVFEASLPTRKFVKKVAGATLSTRNNVVQSNHTKNELSSQQTIVSNTLSGVKTSQSSATRSLANFTSDAQNQNENPRDAKMRLRFQRQTQSRKLLPAKRVATCLRLPVPHAAGIDIMHVPDKDSSHFHGLRTCNSAWDCPVCAAKLSERRRVEVQRAMVLAQDHGLMPALLTFTLAHTKYDSIKYLKDALKACLAKFKSGRAFQDLKAKYNWSGSIMATEATFGLLREIDNGAHIHRHDLVFVDHMDNETFLEFEHDVKAHWMHCVEFLGYSASWEHGAHVTNSDWEITSYIAKHGHEPEGNKWGVDYELTKASSKTSSDHGVTPFQLLDLAEAGNDQAAALFREYSAAMATTSLIRFSAGFREFLGMGKEQTDEQVMAQEDAPAVALTSVTRNTWYQLIKSHFDPRPNLLILARTGDAAALEQYIVSLVPDAQFLREKVEKEGLPMTGICPHCGGETHYLRVLLDADQQAAAEFWCRECAVSVCTYDLTSAQVVEAALVLDALSDKRESPAREVSVEEQLRLFEPRVQFWS